MQSVHMYGIVLGKYYEQLPYDDRYITFPASSTFTFKPTLTLARISASRVHAFGILSTQAVVIRALVDV